MFFFYFAVLMFAGVQGLNWRELTLGWFNGVIRLATMSLGIWTHDSVRQFRVRTNSATHATVVLIACDSVADCRARGQVRLESV